MAQYTQIYEKAIVFYSFLIMSSLGLNSCASKKTDLFIDTKSTWTEEYLSIKPTTIKLEQSSVYYLGVFTLGEFDKFESNIYDQLRISLFSEARYRRPEYELLNITQQEVKNFFNTRYVVKGDLVLKKSIREKMDLMMNHKRSLTLLVDNDSVVPVKSSIAVTEFFPSSGLTDTSHLESVNPVDAEEFVTLLVLDKSKYNVASTQVLPVNDTVLPKTKKNDLLEPLDSSTLSGEVKTQVLSSKELAKPVIVEKSDSVIKETVINTTVVFKGVSVVKENKSQPSVLLPRYDTSYDTISEPKIIEQEEVPEIRSTLLDKDRRTGEIVYIVACFQKDGFVEEKVFITQEEIGYPLEYYVTDKWIRVYLKDVASSSEAKAIFYESWPCAFGK